MSEMTPEEFPEPLAYVPHEVQDTVNEVPDDAA